MKKIFLLSLLTLAGASASADASKFEVKVVDLPPSTRGFVNSDLLLTC